MSTVYLLDGSGYIFRAYYAVAPLSTSAGLPTNAVLGFTRMLVKLLKEETVQHIAVTFDTASKNFRHEIYSEYKANRDECPEDLVPQMPLFREVVEALGIPVYEKEGFEADDILGTLAKKLSLGGNQVVVVSGDKDLFQLVDEQVSVWDAMRDVHYNTQGVFDKFGVRPDQVRDYLALTGDASDNIPGVRGIGPKSAQKLIEYFGDIDQLTKNVEQISEIKGLRGAKGIQSKIESSLNELRLSRELVTLALDVEPYSKYDLEQMIWHGPQMEVANALFEKLEFSNLGKSLAELSGTLDSPVIETDYSEKDFITVSQETLADFYEELSQVSRFAFDTETSSLDPLSCQLVGISISWQAGRAFYLPLGGEAETELQLSADRVRELLGPIFANPEVTKVGLNLKYDISVLEEKGYKVEGVAFDAMLASYLLHPDRRQHNLSALTKRYLDETMLEYKELVEGFENIGQLEIAKVSKYACHDAEASWRLSEKLDPLLGDAGEPESPSLRRVFEEVEMPLTSVLSRMERRGIKIDLSFLEQLGTEYEAELEKLQAKVFEESGAEFNLNSPKQVSKVLFEDLGLPTKGVRKTQSAYSTDAKVLAKLAPKYSVAANLLEYREIHKLKTTYVDALKRLVHTNTGRIHTSFNQHIAATGRLSSSDPNLQNIPIKNARGRQVREAFVAEPGFSILAADYSQIELRILAHLSQDPYLCSAFNRGEDIHTATAIELYGKEELEGDKKSELRRIAKTINFSVIYGMGSYRLSEELGLSRRDATEYIERYFERYSRVKEYFEELKASASQLGYAETMLGRRRYLSEINVQGRDSGYLERSIANMPIQGTAAEIIKLAMLALGKKFRHRSDEVRMLLQVHDELVFEVKSELLEEIRPIILSEMEGVLDLSVPLKVDLRSGSSWGAAV